MNHGIKLDDWLFSGKCKPVSSLSSITFLLRRGHHVSSDDLLSGYEQKARLNLRRNSFNEAKRLHSRRSLKKILSCLEERHRYTSTTGESDSLSMHGTSTSTRECYGRKKRPSHQSITHTMRIGPFADRI